MGVRLREKDDIKTFILYLLLQIDHPIDLATLNDIAVSDDFVNQFDFMDAFYEVSQTDLILKTSTENGEMYSITQKGKNAAELLEGNIVNTIKERSLYSAMKLLSFSRTGAISNSSIREDNGKYYLSCSVNTAENKVLSLEISVDSKGKAEKFKDNFDTKPEFIYRALLSVISGDVNYLADSWIKEERDPVDNEEIKTVKDLKIENNDIVEEKKNVKKFNIFKKNKE